jgi:hypothetical protein
MRITRALGLALGAGTLLLAAVQTASALPAAGAAKAIKAVGEASLVAPVEFKRRPDGSVYYVRPRFDDNGPYFFAYRGYAYPYYPGYAYRLERGELRPQDRPHRYRIAD